VDEPTLGSEDELGCCKLAFVDIFFSFSLPALEAAISLIARGHCVVLEVFTIARHFSVCLNFISVVFLGF
jgi:hypothetical protein